jgi:hypothetical protein
MTRETFDIAVKGMMFAYGWSATGTEADCRLIGGEHSTHFVIGRYGQRPSVGDRMDMTIETLCDSVLSVVGVAYRDGRWNFEIEVSRA